MADAHAGARHGSAGHSLCARDAIFMLAHDEYKGFRCRLHPAVLDLGLGAAMLADLVLLGQVGTTSAGTICLLDYSPAGDVVTAGGQEALAAALRDLGAGGDGPATRDVALPHGGGLPVLAALDVLATDLGERTRAYLLAAGVLVAERRRFGRVRYGPADDSVMVSAWMPARRVVQDGEPDPVGLALCPLVQALGLHEALYLADRAELDPQLTGVATALRNAQDPYPLLPLIADTLRDAVEDRAVAVYR